MNKFRELGYLDDGVYEYACMACREHVYVAGRFYPENHYRFCPWCGVTWEGQHRCRRPDTPRWYWDRWEDSRERDELLAYQESKLGTWELQTRYMNAHHEMTHWQTFRTLACRLGSSKQVKSLIAMRRHFDRERYKKSTHEYRAIIT